MPVWRTFYRKSLKRTFNSQVGLKDNEKALKVLEELSDIVKNPKKSKWDRVNSCIGFLGSVATLTTFSVNDFTINANALISQLKVLINMLPFMYH